MTKHGEAFSRFFIQLTGQSPRFIESDAAIDARIDELARQVKNFKAALRRQMRARYRTLKCDVLRPDDDN